MLPQIRLRCTSQTPKTLCDIAKSYLWRFKKMEIDELLVHKAITLNLELIVIERAMHKLGRISREQ